MGEGAALNRQAGQDLKTRFAYRGSGGVQKHGHRDLVYSGYR